MAACTLLVVGTEQGQMQRSPDLPGNFVLDENPVDQLKAMMLQPLARASAYDVRENAPMLGSSLCPPTTR